MSFGHRSALMTSVLLLVSVGPAPVLADIYRCRLPDGRTVYQETACANGEQKALDDRNARYQAELQLERERRDRQIKEAEKQRLDDERKRQEAARDEAKQAKEHARRTKHILPPAIGMTEEQVLISRWGRPYSVNRTTTARGMHEQWIYRSVDQSRTTGKHEVHRDTYVYLRNGVVYAIQD